MRNLFFFDREHRRGSEGLGGAGRGDAPQSRCGHRVGVRRARARRAAAVLRGPECDHRVVRRKAIREAVRLVPRDRLLLETDSPFLAPVPHRGRRNEPAHVRLVAEKVALVWGSSPEEVGRVTSENAARLFRMG